MRATHGLEHLSRLKRHLSRGPMTDELVFDAVSMRLSAAIEEITPVGESELSRAFGDSWRRIRGTRNAIAHNYRFIDEALLINVIDHHLPEFEAGLRALRTPAE